MPESENYSIKNPLRRDGTSQNQRQLAALDPDFVKVDERTLQDFMVFARDFAKQICFYNKDNEKEGDWESFWTYDLSFIIAAIEQTNPYSDKQDFFGIMESKSTLEGLAKLFRKILGVAGKLDNWYKDFQPGNDFRDQISRLIRSNLGSLLKKLAAYEKGAYSVFGSKDYPEPGAGSYTVFSSIWNLGEYNKIEADTTLFRPIWEPAFNGELPPNPDEDEKLEVAYNKLGKLFTEVYNVYFQVIRLASSWFDKSLLLSDHEPHIALFIAFLKLYHEIQGDLNKLTKKHLDFYYKEVLHLKLKSAVPDKVHLYFKLAKHINEHELTKGTRFIAGKDKTGVDMFYVLDNDIVINNAQIDKIHTIFVERGNDKVKNIFAAPKANSQDGNGAKITDQEKPSWMTLGSNQMPRAKIGFAIASTELLLAEGARTIILTVNYSVPAGEILPDKAKLEAAFTIKLSGEKEWFGPKSPYSITLNNANSSFTITINLASDESAVTYFDEKTLKEKLGTKLPVMKVLLNTETQNSYEDTLDFLENTIITSITLKVNVTGATKILAFNDLGALEITKSFLPFGPSPVVDSYFFIGSREAFQKKLTEITLNFKWENLPKSNSSLDFKNYYLGYDPSPDNSNITFKATIIKSSGENTLTDSGQFFAQPAKDNVNTIPDEYSIDFTDSDSALAYAIQSDELQNYGLKPNYGFIRIDLQRDFEHDQYPNILARQMIAAGWLPDGKTLPGAWYKNLDSGPFKAVTINESAKATDGVIMPNKPYTPTLKSITFDYTSQIELANQAVTNSILINLHPFDDCYEVYEKVTGFPLFPQLHKTQLHKNGSLVPDVNLEGCLLLGIKDLKSGQSLSLLFQVAESTADAEVDEALVHWQYLSENNWKDFEEYEIIDDTTKGFITSGIITFTIPEIKTDKNTILPDSLYWLRAFVEKDSGAVCEMINIHTQAAQITFQDNKNDPGHYDKPLAAKTIGKFEKDDSSIDSIYQDYDSFGGRPAEKPLKFYTRVSERLRHKGRAITLYDYENIVLEQFPDIYKAKCINHTNENDQIAPGHVLLAVIPDFTKLKAVDRRKPKVTLSRLEEIRKYIEERNSIFVGSFTDDDSVNKYLHVVNPKYRKIKMNFSVRFKAEVTAIEYHILKLKEAIIRFLSPWAYEDGTEINFGGKIFKSSILDFVEEQDYVDYVANFKMMCGDSNEDVDFIDSDTARTILIPDEEDNLIISAIIDADICTAENPITGDTLGYTAINDFTITDDN